MNCEFCDTEIKTVPFKCKFCGELFCSDHRLPEKHNCVELKLYKQQKSKKYFKEVVYGKESNKVNAVETSFKERNRDYIDMKKLKELRNEENKSNIFQKLKNIIKSKKWSDK